MRWRPGDRGRSLWGNMAKPTDVRVIGASVYFLPVETRMPLKFGPETLTSVTCARVCLRVQDAGGRVAEGWGETPLSVQWTWPSGAAYEPRHRAMREFCLALARRWAGFGSSGHPMEVGHDFLETELASALSGFPGADDPAAGPMPWLAALVCCSPFDVALHDAYGRLVGQPIYGLYGAGHMNRDLGAFLTETDSPRVSFSGRYPEGFLVSDPPRALRAWHLVGGLDPLEPEELTGSEPRDGYPVLLRDWIRRDGLSCLKVKLRGNDAEWDYGRLVRVGAIAVECGVEWLTADFNCTVKDPDYVNAILDRLRDEHPRAYGMLLYVEQPFPYDIEANPIDVRGLSGRKPLFLDESAHDWRLVRLGRQLGWSGVALKTCKTQTGALLSACWAKAHGMSLMVQDLTNPMLAQVPHVLLAAHAGTIMGVETNATQFYPAASAAEAAVHAGLYERRGGRVDWSTVRGPGFGYRLEEIVRALPPPAIECGG